MSDALVVIVPRDPHFSASIGLQAEVTALLRRLAPSAHDIEARVSESIVFHDAGSNFNGISCPCCRAGIEVDWWQNRMDDDYGDSGFRLLQYALPCCGALRTLNDLSYEYPQAFGRTSWTVWNGNLGALGEKSKGELEAAVGAAVTVVYRHL